MFLRSAGALVQFSSNEHSRMSHNFNENMNNFDTHANWKLCDAAELFVFSCTCPLPFNYLFLCRSPYWYHPNEALIVLFNPLLPKCSSPYRSNFMHEHFENWLRSWRDKKKIKCRIKCTFYAESSARITALMQSECHYLKSFHTTNH